MKKFLAFLMCIVLLMGLVTVSYAAGGIQLPDLPVVDNNENENEAGGGTADDGEKESEEGIEDTVKKGLESADDCTDVAKTDWYYDEIDYAIKNGIFDGTSDTTFSPLKNITRAEFVQVLANLYGVDVSDKNVETSFTDVPSGKWYTPAIKWAKENGIVDGVGENLFAPDKSINRQEMCAMLINYIAFEGNIKLLKKEDKQPFNDDTDMSEWAKEKIYLCQMANLINGMGDGNFEPKSTANRAQAATLFSAFHLDYIA